MEAEKKPLVQVKNLKKYFMGIGFNQQTTKY